MEKLLVYGHQAARRNICQWRRSPRAVPCVRSRGQLVRPERRIGTRTWLVLHIRRFRIRLGIHRSGCCCSCPGTERRTGWMGLAGSYWRAGCRSCWSPGLRAFRSWWMGEPGRIAGVRRSSSLVVAAGELRSSSSAAVAGVRRSLSWAAERSCFSGVGRSWCVAAGLGPSRCFLAAGRSSIGLGSVRRTG